jgi:hypothetical protein
VLIMPLRKLTAMAVHLAVTIAVAGCGEATTPTTLLPVRVSTAVEVGQEIAGITLTVTGPGIIEPLVFSLGLPGVDGTTPPQSFDIPAGPDRIFMGKAFVGPVQSHEGVDTVDVTRNGVSLNLYLRKLFGNGPIDTAIEDFIVQMDDSSGFRADVASTFAAASTTPFFTVLVTFGVTGGGHQKNDPAPSKAVSWASDNPGVATVLSTGCTTSANGTCTIQVKVANGAKAGSSAGIVANAAGIAKRVVLNVP